MTEEEKEEEEEEEKMCFLPITPSGHFFNLSFNLPHPGRQASSPSPFAERLKHWPARKWQARELRRPPKLGLHPHCAHSPVPWTGASVALFAELPKTRLSLT